MLRLFSVRDEGAVSGQVPRISAVIVSGLLGFFLLFAVGFAQISHDAAHDSRHSVAFPCH